MGSVIIMITVNDNDSNTNKPLLIEGAVFVAYIMGKLSYQSTCQQKILEKLPNSNLAQSVRKSRGMSTVSDRLVLQRAFFFLFLFLTHPSFEMA